MPQKTKVTGQLNWIDALKGIAICGIMVVHSGGAAAMPPFLKNYASSGSKCVELFFLLSAYLAFRSLDTHCGMLREKWDLKAVLIWWKGKFIRIIPMYYLALAVYLIVSPQGSGWLGEGGSITILNVLSHLTLTHGFFPYYCNSIMGVEWYLGVLAIFYIIAPFIYRILWSPGRMTIAFLLGNIASYSVNIWLYDHVPQTQDIHIYASYIETYSIVAQIPVILLGALLYMLVSGGLLSKLSEKRLVSYGLLLFCLIMLAAQCYDKSMIFRTSIYTMFGIWFAVLIISQTIHECPLISNPLFAALGKYSYGIYLFHYLIMTKYDEFVTLPMQSEIACWAVKFVICAAVSFVISYLLSKIKRCRK